MSSHRPVIIVAGRHRPHELLLLLYSALLGAGYLAGAPVPASLADAVSSTVVTVWAAVLTVSGVAGLVGCWWRGERGLGVELGALLMNASALLLYSSAVFAAAGMRALLPGGLVAAWAAANVWRAAQTAVDLKSVRGRR